MDKKKRVTVGIVAHVDAGKTTLSEGLLYLAGSIRKLGRVDHQDAFFDTDEQERARGITIFSKQALLELPDLEITLLDTPGHGDFSPEMERTLSVLDAAILVISAADGVTAQVRLLWKLLTRAELPVFLFVNKMDQQGADRARTLAELQKELSDRCLFFNRDLTEEEMQEELALSEEELMLAFLEGEPVTEEVVRRLIRERKVFPCYFGSALKMEGVEEFFKGLTELLPIPEYGELFGARIFKITREEKQRLVWMKLTGGSLKVKSVIQGAKEAWEAKVDQIRLYSGTGYRTLQEGAAGQIVALTGLSGGVIGEGLGFEKESTLHQLQPVLNYQVTSDPEIPKPRLLEVLRQLEEEEPALHVRVEEESKEIFVQVMGSVQLEVLNHLCRTRYGFPLYFGDGRIVYKETIAAPVEGVGHFEPLRHYAEVHLLLEPLERGSGLVFDTDCSEDVLAKNWQRLILTHLKERRHRGVLTGSELTDCKITVIGGKAHVKHTEGGDFRQATYRAVRQGLMCAESVLLEPVFEYRLELPQEMMGRAMADIQLRGGTCVLAENDGVTCALTGLAPASSMSNYQEEVTAYTRGAGRIHCTLKGYEPCHNTEEVLEETAYDPDADLHNPSSSVFCSHGAGTIVPWNQVREHMHVETDWEEDPEDYRVEEPAYRPWRPKEEEVDFKTGARRLEATNKELDEIFSRTFRGSGGAGEAGGAPLPGWKKRRAAGPRIVRTDPKEPDERSHRKKAEQIRKDSYLLVDGYNIIFAWEDLKSLAAVNIDAARDKLMDLLSDYQGSRGCTLILVFDAYKVAGGKGSVSMYHNIHVVYTREAETADMYIEKTVRKIGRQSEILVATSDALEQMIILGGGARRMSAAGLREELERVKTELKEQYLQTEAAPKNTLFSHADAALKEQLEKLRRGETEDPSAQ